ncbi:hypothetical protein BC938DRAFT_474132 [Jimgerdemannia flammicorona]|nr:hypothetical protein BC938DRAFT_474132 [Jimgerdemannia flammicorona]
MHDACFRLLESAVEMEGDVVLLDVANWLEERGDRRFKEKVGEKDARVVWYGHSKPVVPIFDLVPGKEWHLNNPLKPPRPVNPTNASHLRTSSILYTASLGALSVLPTELIIRIVTLLPPPAFIALRSASRSLRRFPYTAAIWRRNLADMFPSCAWNDPESACPDWEGIFSACLADPEMRNARRTWSMVREVVREAKEALKEREEGELEALEERD